MDKYENDIHNATPDMLAQMVEEIARRHVDQDKETLLEAARRLRERPKPAFNDEAFNCP